MHNSRHNWQSTSKRTRLSTNPPRDSHDSQPSPTTTYGIVHTKTMCRRTIQGTIQGTIGSQLAKGQGRLQIHRTIPTIPNNPQPLHSYHQMANNNPHCTHANDLQRSQQLILSARTICLIWIPMDSRFLLDSCGFSCQNSTILDFYGFLRISMWILGSYVMYCINLLSFLFLWTPLDFKHQLTAPLQTD